ncbi:MAG: hypothetical protein HMLIMOIP_000861 [Candidatus Nitrosomirales archaeon]|jgi:hypothetical protein
MVAIVCSLFIPPVAYGYASSFSYGTQAKWNNNLNFMICISSIEEKEYEDLFVKAIDEWKDRWNHFGYMLSRGSGCHINVYIVKTHHQVTDHGYVGYTSLEYWEHGAITKAEIILPTHTKNYVSTEVKSKIVTTEVLEPLSKTQFYRAALHEFGHALGLGHFDDNGEEPIDIMHAYPASDDQDQGISQRDIEALNWLYLGFFENEMSLRTDRKSYNAGETIKIFGKVNPVLPSELVRLEIVDLSKKLYTSDSVSVDRSGTFNYNLKISPEIYLGGSFKIKAFYNNMITDASFNVKHPEVSEMNYSSPEAGRRVTVLETYVANSSGSRVVSAQPNEQVFIRSSLFNGLREQAEATYIVQIKNAEGFTVEISSSTYNLVTDLSIFSQSWLPAEPGKYDIQIFLWKGISAPEPYISMPIELSLIVS